MGTNYLESVIKQMEYYKMLGEKTFAQLEDEQLFWQHHAFSNSIAIIVQHLHGNMLSRWTNFLTSDGEKTWRKRDQEFEPVIDSRAKLMALWTEGWQLTMETIGGLKADDLTRIVLIRNEGHTVIDAINRQLAHYPYHIGQIVFIGTMMKGSEWNSLSIPRGQSQRFNTDKFSK